MPRTRRGRRERSELVTTAVLLMAYGSPRTPDEVEPYFTDIRGGRPPSAEILRILADRYERIGGKSPLNEITAEVAKEVSAELETRAPGQYRVFTGMKHWHPFIAATVDQIAGAGITKILGLVLAPHYSSKSIGEYEARILKARDTGDHDLNVNVVRFWYDEPAFVEMVATNLREAIGEWDTSDADTKVFFCAHSIPARIVAAGDPYADQLSDSARVFAEAAGIANFDTAWQSESTTGEPWLGPDLLVRLEQFAAVGGKKVVVAPVGFVADHLEVLYDLDVQARDRAAQLGLAFARTAVVNDDPAVLGALATRVAAAAGPA